MRKLKVPPFFKRKIIIGCLFILGACIIALLQIPSSAFLSTQTDAIKKDAKIDSIFFGDYNGKRMDIDIASFRLETLDGKEIWRFYSDSIYQVRVNTGILERLDPELYSKNENVRIQKTEAKNVFNFKISSTLKEGNKYLAKIAVGNNLPKFNYLLIRRTKDKSIKGYHDRVHDYDTLVINIIKIHQK